jgi:hypothetical protein
VSYALNRAYRVAAKIILDASNVASGVTLMAGRRSRHFNVTTTGELTAVQVTFAGGRVINPGGFAWGGSLYLDGGAGYFLRCTFSNNSVVAGSTGTGGAIQNGRFPVSANLGATLTMIGCSITQNWIRSNKEAYGGKDCKADRGAGRVVVHSPAPTSITTRPLEDMSRCSWSVLCLLSVVPNHWLAH